MKILEVETLHKVEQSDCIAADLPENNSLLNLLTGSNLVIQVISDMLMLGKEFVGDRAGFLIGKLKSNLSWKEI